MLHSNPVGRCWLIPLLAFCVVAGAMCLLRSGATKGERKRQLFAQEMDHYAVARDYA
jgi:hypothetical protein